MTPSSPGAAALRESTLAGDTSASATVDAAIARTREVEGGAARRLNIFLALDAAMMSDTEPGRLLGVPVAIKDNIATTTLATTCGSRILEGYVSPFEATAVRKLREK